MPASADSNTNVRQFSCTPNSTAAGETGEDSYIHLADWTLSVTAIDKKKKKKKEEEEKEEEEEEKKKNGSSNTSRKMKMTWT